jgi:serine protease inhibitor
LSLKTEHNEEYLYNYLRAIQNLESKSGLVQINIANSIFAADDLQIKSDFTAALDTFYKSDVHRVTFKNKKETAETINKFVNDKTKGLIEKIITEDAFDALSRLIMVNAIYFKGQWRKTFPAGKTTSVRR